MGPEWVVLIIAALIVLVVALTTRGTDRGGSTAGHYDADAIGGYTMDPATQAYRYDLPTLPRASRAAPPGSGPPHRRRRRRRRPTDPGD